MALAGLQAEKAPVQAPVQVALVHPEQRDQLPPPQHTSMLQGRLAAWPQQQLHLLGAQRDRATSPCLYSSKTSCLLAILTLLDRGRAEGPNASLTRLQIPERPSQDPQVAAVYNARAEGRQQLPGVCEPDASVTCSKCHQCNWGELEADGDGKPSLVVLASAVVHTTFKLRRCCTDGCDASGAWRPRAWPFIVIKPRYWCTRVIKYNVQSRRTEPLLR
jgi:hypothetical protein